MSGISTIVHAQDLTGLAGQDNVGTVGSREKILMTVDRVRIASQRAVDGYRRIEIISEGISIKTK